MSIIRPGDRLQHLTALRRDKMARSVHSYVRGSTDKFYAWLGECAANIPDGPPIWICGDCHVGNLGPLADEKGKVAIQMRDLDQTVIGNPAHDLIRLGLSLAAAARSADLPGVATANMLAALAQGYRRGVDARSDEAHPRTSTPQDIHVLLRTSLRRRWKHLALERLHKIEPKLPLGHKFWPVSAKERKALNDLFASEDVRHVVTCLKQRPDDAMVELVDVAFWVKGCSSLGRGRYSVLLRVTDGEDKGYCLIDIKEAAKPAAPRFKSRRLPRDNAARVVAGAMALSPNLGSRMLPVRFMGKAMVLRELLPQDMKLEVNRLESREALELATYLGAVVGQAHGRQLDRSDRKTWAKTLDGNRAHKPDMPSWLWSSVVDLMAIHERAYLDYCRFLLSEAG